MQHRVIQVEASLDRRWLLIIDANVAREHVRERRTEPSIPDTVALELELGLGFIRGRGRAIVADVVLVIRIVVIKALRDVARCVAISDDSFCFAGEECREHGLRTAPEWFRSGVAEVSR